MSARDAIIDEIKTAPESLVWEAYDFMLPDSQATLDELRADRF